MPTVQIKPAGSVLPRVEKYAKETIVYRLDCAALLEPMELVGSAAPINVPEGVVVVKCRAKDGNAIEVTISNTDLEVQVYQDFIINIAYETTAGNTRVASFQLRVHR